MNQFQFIRSDLMNQFQLICFVLDLLIAQVSFHSLSHSKLNVWFNSFSINTWDLLNIRSTCYSKINRISLLSYNINTNLRWKSSLFWRWFSKSRNCKSCCTSFNSYNCSRSSCFFVKYHVNATLNCNHVVHLIVFESSLIFDSFVYLKLNLHYLKYVIKSTALKSHHS